MPKSIMGDTDVLFTNNFWMELFKLMGTKLAFSSAFIIRMDRQRRSSTQLKCIFNVLWRISHWLPRAEFCYKALHTTSFEVIYGREPPQLLSYVPGSSRVEAIDVALMERDQVLGEIRHRV